MNAKLVDLAERRATLVAKAAAQRAKLSQQLAPWRGPLAVVDQGVAAARYLGSHPALLAALLAFSAVSRPRRIVNWLRRGWVLWRVVRAARKRLMGY